MTKRIDEQEAERHRAKMAKRKAVQDAEVAGKAVEKGKLEAAARDETAARLSGTVDLAALADDVAGAEAHVRHVRSWPTMPRGK